MAARQDAAHPYGHFAISRMECRSIAPLVAAAASAIGAAAVRLRALLNLRGDHLVLNFGEDLLAFL